MTESFQIDLDLLLSPLTNSYSGTEYIVSKIADSLYEQNKNFGLILPNIPSLDMMASSYELKANSIHRINSIEGKKSFGQNLKRSVDLFNKLQPTAIHFHCPNVRWGLDVIMAASLTRVPYIIRTEHNPLMGLPSILIRTMLRLASQRVSAFTYVSVGNKKRYEKLLPYRIGRGHVIHNGIDCNKFYSEHNVINRKDLRKEFDFPEDCSLAVFVGAYQDRRPLQPILEAFKSLLDSPKSKKLAEKWRLLIVGTGPEEQSRLVDTLGLKNYVAFAGKRSNIDFVLRQCDLFVTASHFEGMSLAILEAWASGLPVLATQVDGLIDIIGQDNFQSYMIKTPQAEPFAFAEAWYDFMISNPERIKANEEAMKNIRTNFTIDSMISDYNKLYTNLFGNTTK